MRRAVFASLLTLTLAASAKADVTIRQSSTGKGLGMSGTTAGTTCIKGARMRSVSAGALADDLFAVPTGDKLKERT